MAEITTVPLTIEPEAAARIAELDMQAEFERMLEHIRQTVPSLQRLDVLLALPYDTGDETSITIEATVNAPNDLDDRMWWEFSNWKINTFSPDIFRFFNLTIIYGNTDAR